MHFAAQNKKRPPIHDKLGRRPTPLKVRHPSRRRTLRLTQRTAAGNRENKERKEYRETKFFQRLCHLRGRNFANRIRFRLRAINYARN